MNGEIRSYSHNGVDWEWNGDGWPADKLARDGDFSAYADGESICLRFFSDDGEQIDELIGVVYGGEIT